MLCQMTSFDKLLNELLSVPPPNEILYNCYAIPTLQKQHIRFTHDLLKNDGRLSIIRLILPLVKLNVLIFKIKKQKQIIKLQHIIKHGGSVMCVCT